MWAMGAIMAELFTLRPLFPGSRYNISSCILHIEVAYFIWFSSCVLLLEYWLDRERLLNSPSNIFCDTLLDILLDIIYGG